MKGATKRTQRTQRTKKFQSTLPMKGATLYGVSSFVSSFCISIHAPNEGSDQRKNGTITTLFQFQSTLPMKGATLFLPWDSYQQSNFNPRSQ